MRPQLFILLLLLNNPFLSLAQDDSTHFKNISYAEALKMAQQENKPVFFMCYASWCPHCHKMLAQVFHDKAVAEYFNNHFICTKQDMEIGEGIKLHNKFQVKAYPTFVFLDGNGTTLYQTVGEFKDSSMIKEGKYALTPEMQFPYLKKLFEADPGNADNCLKYIFALRGGRLDCQEPAKQHLATQSDKELLTPMNWKIIANGVQDINSREFQFVLAHQKEFAAIASPARVERKIVGIADDLLSVPATKGDSAEYFSKRPAAAVMHYPLVDSLLFHYDLLVCQKTNNWKEYKKIAEQGVPKYAWNDVSQLKDILNNYFVYITDTSALLSAVKWALRGVELQDDYACYIWASRLYKKAGDKKQATDMAITAKNFAEKYTWPHVEADELLKELK